MPANPPPSATDPRDESVQCMRRLAAGDESALAELYRRWSKPLFNFLVGMCGDRTLAEDLLQEVFVRVWRAAPRYEPTARFSTWLFHVARNHWLNEREKRLVRIRPQSLDRSAGPESDEAAIETPDARAPSPETEALAHELGDRIRRAVARLPEKLRETWALAVTQGMPYPDVAETLGVPVGTVKSRMFQAVRLVRTELAPYVGEDAEDPPDDVR